METIVLAGCYLISCFICAFIAFHFMEERYQRKYRSKWIYIASCAGISIFLAGVNYVDNPALNYILWLVAVGACVSLLYQENGAKPMGRILESEAFFIAIAFTETMGVFLVEWLIPYMDITDPLLIRCMSVLVSKAVIVFFYYYIVRFIFTEHPSGASKRRYLALLLILIYSSASILAVMTDFFQRLDWSIVAINLACIVFIDLYLLSFLKSTSEKKIYEEKIRLQEQQAKLQYEYYVQQEQKYDETLRILHDVNKHVRTINELAVSGNVAQTVEYAEQIRTTLRPLIPEEYTDNPILNVLLSDKMRQTRDKGIKLKINLGDVSFHFMEAMDITTIFGNLLDNAIEACEELEEGQEKMIRLFAERFQEMISVTMENDSKPVTWKSGFPVSKKGKNRGIGLMNVGKSIDKYDGSLKLREEPGKFITEFFINRY